jgi:hypothetical protein
MARSIMPMDEFEKANSYLISMIMGTVYRYTPVQPDVRQPNWDSRILEICMFSSKTKKDTDSLKQNHSHSIRNSIILITLIPL